MPRTSVVSMTGVIHFSEKHFSKPVAQGHVIRLFSDDDFPVHAQ